MLSLRGKIDSPAEALLKLTLMGRAPARSGVAHTFCHTRKHQEKFGKSISEVRLLERPDEGGKETPAT